MAVYDYECKNGHLFEHRCSLSDKPDSLICPLCGTESKQVIVGAPTLLTTIIPSYPGCKKQKAGYTHSHADKSATKVQSGYGGTVNPNTDKIELGKKLTGLA